MKITHNDGNVLQVQEKPGILILLFGVIFLVVGLVVFLTLGQSSSLVCERTLTGRTQCRIEKNLLGILNLQDEPLEALKGARVAHYEDSDGDDTYKVILVTSTDEVPLTSGSSSGYSGKKNIVDQINNFFGDTRQPSLRVQQKGTWGLIIGGIFALIGLAVTIGGLQSLSITWTFDRLQGTVFHIRQGVIGAKATTYPLRDIVEARVGVSRDSDGDDTYRVELYDSTHQMIPLTRYYTSGRTRKAEIAQAIDGFIKR